jgi:chromatin assembly factor 1 subunit B
MQQHTLQLQSIAHHNSLPISYPTNSNTPSGSGSSGNPSFTAYHPGSSNTHHSSGSVSSQITPAATPISGNVSLPPFVPATTVIPLKKRNERPLTPAASVDGSEGPIAQQQPQSVEGSLDAKPSSVLPMKRNEPPLTPAASVDGSEGPSNIAQPQPQSVEGGLNTKAEAHDKVQEPPKKKRRVALTRVGDLES